MFCMNCGTQLADDAAFCFKCGNRVNGVAQPEVTAVNEPVMEAVAQPIMEPVIENNMPTIEPIVETVAEPVVEAVNDFPVEQQPVYQAQPEFQQPLFQEQPVFQAQPEFQQPLFQEQPVFQPQPGYQQPTFQGQPNVKKKNSKAFIPTIIFAILSIISSVAICINGFMDKEIGMGIENIIFAVAAIIVIIYAANKSAAMSIIKGVFFIAVTVLHVIYFCVPGAKTAINKLTNFFDGSSNATGTDCYYGFVMLLLIVFFAIYMIMNVIRSFMNAKKSSMLVVVSGYFTVLLVIVCFVVDIASKIEGLFAFGFIPIVLGFVTLVLADIFAIISRAKKFEN